MKNYFITSEQHIYEWSNVSGEGEHLDTIFGTAVIVANDEYEAIKKYITEQLGLSYNKDNITVGLNSENEVNFSVIVDDDNIEDEQGNFVNDVFIYVNEITPVNLTKKDIK